jgi:hypothetical protein
MKATISLDMTANLTGRSVRNDYGVPGSPVWYDVEDISIDTVHMFDREWTHDELEAEFGNLAEWIINEAETEDFEDE